MQKIESRRVLSIIALLALVGLIVWAADLYKRNVNFPIIKRLGLGSTTATNTTGLPLSLPDGFSISTYAEGLKRPRVMVFAPTGDMVVSDIGSGEILALPDRDNDGKADGERVLAKGLNNPHGLLFLSNTEFLTAEEHRVNRWNYDTEAAAIEFDRVLTSLPDGGSHSTRSLGLGEDGHVYISVGSTCNACDEEDDKRAAILRMKPDGSDLQVWASGLRNTVFFTPHPTRDEFWGADMGRDLLGDNLPPEEINVIPDGGTPPGDYGWPLCFGAQVPDATNGGNEALCKETKGSLFDLPAHVAPLGLEFIPEGTAWPDDWAGDLILALHGSWNSSKKVGYKLVRLEVNDNQEIVAMHDFLTGFLTEKDEVIGRPAGLLMDGDGTLYIADDGAGRIFAVKPMAK